MEKKISTRNKFTRKYREMNPVHVVTVSNIISIARALLTLPILYYLRKGNSGVALAFILVAIASDMLDGWLARISNEITDIGKIIDPLADKIVIFSVMLYLILKNMMPTFYLVILVLRDTSISILGIYILNNCKVSPQSNKMGKVAVIFNSLSILAFIYPDFSGEWKYPLMYVALVFMLISWIQYCLTFIREIHTAKHLKKSL